MTGSTLPAGQARLLYTMLRVRDLEAALAFNTDRLGTRLLRRREFPEERFALAFLALNQHLCHQGPFRVR